MRQDYAKMYRYMLGALVSVAICPTIVALYYLRNPLLLPADSVLGAFAIYLVYCNRDFPRRYIFTLAAMPLLTVQIILVTSAARGVGDNVIVNSHGLAWGTVSGACWVIVMMAVFVFASVLRQLETRQAVYQVAPVHA